MTPSDLTKENEELKDALRAYAITYPCPGFEVGIGAGETSSCNGRGGDCPTCITVEGLNK